jgi:hypothetical protein
MEETMRRTLLIAAALLGLACCQTYESWQREQARLPQTDPQEYADQQTCHAQNRPVDNTSSAKTRAAIAYAQCMEARRELRGKGAGRSGMADTPQTQGCSTLNT